MKFLSLIISFLSTIIGLMMLMMFAFVLVVLLFTSWWWLLPLCLITLGCFALRKSKLIQ